MTKEDIISKFQAKRDEGKSIRTSIEALMPIRQIDRYRFEYRSEDVNKLRNTLSLWQKQVYYMLLGVFGNKHSMVREFASTTISESALVDEKVELMSEVDDGLILLDTLLSTIDFIIYQDAVIAIEDSPKAATKSDDLWHIMHPEVERVSKRLFEGGFYAEAVVDAFKEIDVKVRALYTSRTGLDKSGASLMLSAFSVNNPILKFQASSTYSDDDVQEGYMHMFAGAMKGIRNPKSHENEKIGKEDALRKLAFASMLMYKFDTVIK